MEPEVTAERERGRETETEREGEMQSRKMQTVKETENERQGMVETVMEMLRNESQRTGCEAGKCGRGQKDTHR